MLKEILLGATLLSGHGVILDFGVRFEWMRDQDKITGLRAWCDNVSSLVVERPPEVPVFTIKCVRPTS